MYTSGQAICHLYELAVLQITFFTVQYWEITYYVMGCILCPRALFSQAWSQRRLSLHAHVQYITNITPCLHAYIQYIKIVKYLISSSLGREHLLLNPQLTISRGRHVSYDSTLIMSYSLIYCRAIWKKHKMMRKTYIEACRLIGSSVTTVLYTCFTFTAPSCYGCSSECEVCG